MHNTDAPFDPREFRRALGMFGTGVTIVTTRTASGEAVGITANSFNSVSLEPPMVLWSLAKSARSLPVFQEAQTWNVHILSNEQEALSNRFARAGEDKFAGLQLDSGDGEAPLLPECSARFRCKTAFQYDGGDHIIFVGEVTQYDANGHAPLLYVTGGYALASRKSQAIASEPQADANAAYSENLIGYLLGRAHFQFLNGIRKPMSEQGLTDADFYVLSLLSIQQPLTPAQIAQHVAYIGIDIGQVALQSLARKGLVEESAQLPQALQLTAAGNESILHLLAAAKAVEAEIVDSLGEMDAVTLRNLLKKTIAATDPGLPKLWQAPAASAAEGAAQTVA
ncbi:3-hydroxy-9,10-secoandrosta-1,3,5(10)-triene-9,17-dione monooxygenase reductase component [Oryzisolibacter propanilivorax]|uniref:3-hydroxy-9,10-secoandrosta-1,3,5(10)-triene-9,17-dione monooxygenase reductase component n=1 Tax=Oryzisolibacter propanilivorax TaxID=1527607 RepID=A0A1G9NYS4_9BURK|nr:flavin reductase [Oryzisolibacter propanilivorax]SDL91443.1 3-hydroxy-9,10-secoandrosta-1,3,5(10)-triene-9,17-dione monooxygenase reductase component [Oryzisolibacter propanilivorax]